MVESNSLFLFKWLWDVSLKQVVLNMVWPTPFQFSLLSCLVCTDQILLHTLEWRLLELIVESSQALSCSPRRKVRKG